MKKCAETAYDLAYDLSYELSSCERNGVFSSMFRKISVSKQSISSAFMFLRMLRSCFITNIRFFFCFLRKISELCGSASPHPVRCHACYCLEVASFYKINFLKTYTCKDCLVSVLNKVTLKHNISKGLSNNNGHHHIQCKQKINNNIISYLGDKVHV